MTTVATPFKAKAVYSWGGNDKGKDLGFIEDDIIEVIRAAQDQNTFYGQSLRTKLFGYFPSKYVQALDIEQNDSRRNLRSIVQQQTPTKSTMRNSYQQSPSSSMPRYDSSMSLSNTPYSDPNRTSFGRKSQTDLNRTYNRSPIRSSPESPTRSPYRGMSPEPRSSTARSPFRGMSPESPVPKSNRNSYSRGVSPEPPKLFGKTSNHDPGRTFGRMSTLPDPIVTRSSPPLLSVPYERSHHNNSSHSSDLYSSARNSNSTAHTNYMSDEDEDKSLPPIPPKHQFSASTSTKDKLFKTSYTQRLLDASTNSTDTEKSSYFGHSDFSATSAGSYMRHKESKMQNKLMDLEENGPNTVDRQDLLQQLFEDTDKTKHPKFFKKFLGTKKPQPSLDDQIFGSSVAKMAELGLTDKDNIPFGASASYQQQDIFTSSDSSNKFNNSGSGRERSSPSPEDVISSLVRTKSLTSQERSFRKSRALEDDCHLILQPHRAISSLNNNEIDPTAPKRMNIDATPLMHVDKYIRKLPADRFASFEDIIRDRIGNKFNTDLENLRAIYVYLTTKFSIKFRNGEKLSTKQCPSSSTLNDIMHSKKCSQHQLTWIFHIMCDLLNIETEIILGRFKRPFEYDMKSSDNKSSLELNHSWISVLIEGEYRFIDVSLANHSNPILQQEMNIVTDSSIEDISNFYFLTKPLDLVFTHIPLHIDHQHIMPPIDPVVQVELPSVYPHFVTNKLRLYKFNQAVFRLQDFEIVDFDLEIPMNFEIKCMVIPLDKESNETVNAFVQVYWKKGRRIAKIKSILPPRCSIGFVSVYGREIDTAPLPKLPDEFEQEKNPMDDFCLLLSVPAFHKGKYSDLEWCHLNSDNSELPYDIYIKEPQVYKLQQAQTYNFTIHHNSSNSLDEDTFKCGLLTPTDKFIELERINSEVWEARKNVRETGFWRLIVMNHGKWHVFSEWSVDV